MDASKTEERKTVDFVGDCCQRARLLLTAKESAAMAGCGLRTWLRWTACGLAPRPIRIGLGVRPAVRWSKTELESWANNGCQPVEKGGAK